MRNLPDVIRKIINVIPATETSAIAVLKDTQSSAMYAPPELESFWWDMCAERLSDELGEPDELWKKEVATIFSGN